MITLRHIRIPGLLALCALMSLNLFAQSFTFETPKKYELNIDPASWKDATIYFKNTGDKDLAIEWTVLSNTLVQGWDYSLCDNGNCYIGIPAKSESAPLAPEEKGFFKLAVSAENIKGKGELVIMMANKNNPDEKDTIAFSVNVAGASSIAGVSSGVQFDIFPNPTRENLSISLAENIERATLTILTVSGQMISNKILTGGQHRISVSELSAGAYILRVVTSEGAHGTKLFIKE